MSNVVPLYPDDQYQPVGQHHHHIDGDGNGYEAIIHHSDEIDVHHRLDHEKLDVPFDPCRGPNCAMRRHDDV